MSTQPFLDHGHYTSVHDAIFDVLMPVCPPNAWKVVCFILRKTIGWKKDEDDQSYRQIMQGTGIKSPDTLANALWFLTSFGVILVRSNDDTWQSNRYRINRNFVLSDALAEQMRNAKLTKRSATETVVESLTTETVVEPTTETVVEPTTETVASKKQQRKKQQKNTDDATASSLNTAIMQTYAALILEHEQRKIADNGSRYMRTINAMVRDGFQLAELPVLAACYKDLKREDFWQAKPLHLDSLWTHYGPWKVGHKAQVIKLIQNTNAEHAGNAPDEQKGRASAMIQHELEVTFGGYHNPLEIGEEV